MLLATITLIVAMAPDAPSGTGSTTAQPALTSTGVQPLVEPELDTALARQAALTAALDTAKTTSAALRAERDAVAGRNERLDAQVDALTRETAELTRELLDLELELLSVTRVIDDAVETVTVYNFVNVPIGGGTSGASPDGAYASLATDDESERWLPAAEPDDRTSLTYASDGDTIEFFDDPAAYDMVDAFYDSLDSGLPLDQLQRSLDDIAAAGRVDDEQLGAMQAELTYLAEDGSLEW